MSFLIIIVLILLVVLIWIPNEEKFCNCSGVSTMTDRPTYYVYRPNGDVSCPSKCSPTIYNGQCKPTKINVQYPSPLVEFSNLGWKKTAGIDSSMFGDSWAAGGGCNSSSVPFVTMNPPPQSCQNNQMPKTYLTSLTTAVPYSQNYGTPSCNMRTLATTPLMPQQSCNLKLSQTPNISYQNPSGSFSSSSKCCGGPDAYNLAVGVL
jgi:hypothetical protein